MEMLNIGFAILLAKVVLCVLPGVAGAYLLSSDRERMRALRAWVCNQLFGVSNAFEYNKFSRFMRSVGAVLVAISLAATWFVLLRGYFTD